MGAAWILGEHSSPGGWHAATDSGKRYAFREDGSVGVTHLEGCGSSEEHFELSWSEVDEDAVELLPEPDAEALGSEGHVVRLEPLTCDRTNWTDVNVDTGDETVGGALARGRVCFEAAPPCSDGSECDWCYTVWCGGREPPKCE